MYAIPFLTLVVLAVLFYLIQPSIKRNSVLYYVGALIISIFSAYYMITLGHPKDISFWQKLYKHTFGVGVVGNTIFIIVMYVGALSNDNKFRKRIMPIRGELSIIATLFVLIHNVVFGQRHFVNLFTNIKSMDLGIIIAAIISILAIIVMIPLFITSFKCVKSKMDSKKWIKLQRLAYVFYLLIFIHIVVIKITSINFRIGAGRDIKEPIITLCYYLIVYISYGIIKYKKDKFHLGEK